MKLISAWKHKTDHRYRRHWRGESELNLAHAYAASKVILSIYLFDTLNLQVLHSH